MANMKPVLVPLAVLVVLVALSVGDSANAGAKVDPESRPEDGRARESHLNVPDFNKFKALFHKHYDSIAEELRRKKLFLARSFESAVSTMRYKLGLSDYKLGVNEMSDWTAEEQRKLFSNQPLLPEHTEPDPAELQMVLRQAELEREQKLSRSKREILYKDGKKLRELRDVITEREMDESRFRYLRSAAVQLNMAESKMPNFARPVDWYELWSMDEDKWARIYNNARDPAKQNQPADEGKPDELWVDHSKSECMPEPRSQRLCGACYAFAAVSLLEYLNCKEKGKLELFSEQYFVDCGTSRREFQMFGCLGGLTSNVASLAKTIGLHYLEQYPYRADFDVCPRPAEEDPIEMGALRTDMSSGLIVKKFYMDKYIEFGPMIVSIKLPSDFMKYAGGVHDGADCDLEQPAGVARHAMLLVGHGRENGHEYWLLRNSFGPTWGSSGHFKLNKLADCFQPKAGYMIATLTGREFELNLRPNPLYKMTQARPGFTIPFTKMRLW